MKNQEMFFVVFKIFVFLWWFKISKNKMFQISWVKKFQRIQQHFVFFYLIHSTFFFICVDHIQILNFKGLEILILLHFLFFWNVLYFQKKNKEHSKIFSISFSWFLNITNIFLRNSKCRFFYVFLLQYLYRKFNTLFKKFLYFFTHFFIPRNKLFQNSIFFLSVCMQVTKLFCRKENFDFFEQ